MSKPGQEPRNEDEFVAEAITRAVARAGVLKDAEREALAHALADCGVISLGDIRARLIDAGVPEDVVDFAVKAGIVARESARFGFKLEALQRSPAG